MIAALLGVAVGLVLGLTGAGGSILAAPLLMMGLGWTLTQAMPVALMAVCAAATFGTIVAWDVTYVRRRAAGLIALIGAATSPLGLEASRALPLQTLTVLFSAILAVVALRLVRQALRAPADAAVVRATVHGEGAPAAGHWVTVNERGRIQWDNKARVAIALIGAATGFFSGMFGLGGGFIIVPALRSVSVLSMHSAVATSLYAIAMISAVTVVHATLLGMPIPWGPALPFVLGSLAGMLLGRKLAPRIAGPRLQEGFGAFMLLVAIGLGARALGLF